MKSRQQPGWLSEAVIYEIYPQSFQDSNGDGIGDLKGIIARLPYIQSLGCNAIWLNPCFESPFGDAGYDVSDFRKVASRYGTNEDLVILFREAHAMGLKVILDLVAGHTSIEHPWFKESSKHERNAYSDYYIWTSTVWESPPEMTTVRGSAERNAGYVPNFFHFQPALNFGFAEPDPNFPWQQPASAPGPRAVKQELLDIMKFWLELGCDGFRVDMAASLIKGKGKVKQDAMAGIWGEVRSWFDQDWPEAVLIAEWSNPQDAITAGFHVDFLIHFGQPAYNSLFRAEGFGEVVPGGKSYFAAEGKGDITIFSEYFDGAYEATKDLGYISIPTGNHDIVPRLANGRTPEELRVAMAFLFTMPGIPVIYQGDEIGMRHIAELPSKEGGYERTGSRTPMQWDGSAKAGFSEAGAESLYLPLDPDPQRPDVETQEGDPESLLNFVKRLVALRKEHPALGPDGEYRTLYAEKGSYPFAFERKAGGECFLVVVNPSAGEVSYESTYARAKGDPLLVQKAKLDTKGGKLTLQLAGAGYVVVKVE
ncbi:alpha-amylase family glycosyl hydrolase [soil metagenome]